MSEQDDLCPPFITRASALQDAQARRLADAIRELQWGGQFGGGTCPSCGSTRQHGHAIGCAVGLALLPDGGVGALHDALAEGMHRVKTRRQSLQLLVGAATGELDDIAECLEWVQDMLHLLEHNP